MTPDIVFPSFPLITAKNNNYLGYLDLRGRVVVQKWVWGATTQHILKKVPFFDTKLIFSCCTIHSKKLLPPGGAVKYEIDNGCKGRAQTGWGIQWEHRLKKWGVIGWEHEFWHSVREKYKNMWGHGVRAWTWLVFSMVDCKITKVNFFTCQLFKSWGFEWQIKCKNMGLWVWAHATVKKYGVYGCQRCWKRGSFDPYIRVATRMGLPPRAFATDQMNIGFS